uniref:Uncharacterized protein n=1 Tax=viral metagenome TaxID=1070528 RepID=A0A6M3LPU5_9ZZZZ
MNKKELQERVNINTHDIELINREAINAWPNWGIMWGKMEYVMELVETVIDDLNDLYNIQVEEEGNV